MAQMKSKLFQMNIQLLEHTTVQHPIPSFDQSQQIYHQVWIFIKSSPIFLIKSMLMQSTSKWESNISIKRVKSASVKRIWI